MTDKVKCEILFRTTRLQIVDSLLDTVYSLLFFVGWVQVDFVKA